MTTSQAKKHIQTYVNGWKANDAKIILKPLSPNCKIIESHGPIYTGIETIRKWIEVWLRSEGEVTRWDITSFSFIDAVATFEWTFACEVNKKEYYIEGISVVHFQNNKISYIREYRTTKSTYVWNEKELSE